MRNPLIHKEEEDIEVRGFLVLVILSAFLALVCSMAFMVFTPPEPGPYQRPAVDPTQTVRK